MTSTIGDELPGYAEQEDPTDIPDFGAQSFSTNGSEGPNYAAIFEAPDYSTLVKLPKTAVSRDYEKRVQSMLKAGVIGAINSGRYSDAAALLHFGPGFAAASGDLASADARAKKLLDYATSPSSPVLIFAMTIVPLISQLWRNHEDQLQEMPKTYRQLRAHRKQAKTEQRAADATAPRVQVKLPLVGKTLSMPVRLKFKLVKNVLASFRTQTKDPDALAMQVFSDEKLIKTLEKQGIRIRVERV